MKRAYLFGAAALLILLIVVAYVSYSRKTKDGGVCVRPPPQVVGPNAPPVERTLTFSEEGDEEEVPLVLNRPRNRPVGGPSATHQLLRSDTCIVPDHINYDKEMLKIFQRDKRSWDHMSAWEYGERGVLQEWKTPVKAL
jgi:hypothetical protein